jgi:alkylation response protein AidB-like acyl-CoA dehydrogenase
LDHESTTQHEPLRQAVRHFITTEVNPLEREHGLTWDVAPPKDLHRQVRVRAKELGLYAPDMPESAGGAGLSFLGRCVLEMELHSHDTVFFEDVLGGGGGPTPILLAGTQAQQDRFLAPLVAGETTTCFALSEPDAGSDASNLRTRATPAEGGWVLNGTKNIVSNGPHADFGIVFAMAGADGGPAGVTAFLVDSTTSGYDNSHNHTCMGFTGFQGEIALADVRVGADAVLGEVGKGFALAMDWINANRIRTAAMATGIARRALARSTAYALQRTQFGAPIGSFQAIQLKLADMATELYAAESIVERSAWMKDQGQDIRKVSAMTKLYASEMVNRHAYEAVQIHGGVGCLEETGIERIYRMVRILTILEGTSEMMRLTVADRVLKQGAR